MQLLDAAARLLEEDRLDAAAVLLLGAGARSWLAEALRTAHPGCALLDLV